MFLPIEQLMIIAGPWVGREYDPGKPIDGKGSDFFDENEDELIKQQGYEPTWGIRLRRLFFVPNLHKKIDCSWVNEILWAIESLRLK